MQNFFSNMAPSGGGEGGPQSDQPWWMKYAGKGAGIGGGLGKYHWQVTKPHDPLFNFQWPSFLASGAASASHRCASWRVFGRSARAFLSSLWKRPFVVLA